MYLVFKKHKQYLGSFSFVRGGYVFAERGSLRHLGDYSYNWSRVAAAAAAFAYQQLFDDINVYSSNIGARVYAFSVRCLAL